jgi:hypothetical protein
MPRFEFKFKTFLWFYAITFVCVENRVCLSRGVGDMCDMAGNNEDQGRSRRHGADDRG